MDRRKLLFSFSFFLGLPNIQAQQAPTPVSTPVPGSHIERYQTGLSDPAKAAQEPFHGVVIAKTMSLHDWNAVEGNVDTDLRHMARLIRGRHGVAETTQQDHSLPRHIATQLRTVVTTATNMTAEEARQKLDIAGPLTRVSLSSAIRRESVKGIPLKEPDNGAGKTFAAMNVQHEHSVARQFRPDRNQHPIWYKPLYFEDPNMERCGRGIGVFNEALSAVRFFGRIPALPTMLANNPPCHCVRALPDCPTCHKFGHESYLSVPEPDGALLQIAAAVGLIFLIP
jgi:hypothetical protein